MTEDNASTAASTPAGAPAAGDTLPSGAGLTAGRAGSLRAVAPVLIRDILLPYGVYYVLHKRGVGNVPALAAGGAVNVFFTLTGLIRKRRIGMLGLIVLVTFVLGIAASYVTGDARFALAKDSVLTGGVGLAFLLSLLAARPIMYVMIRQLLTEGDPARAAELDRRWEASPGFRRRQRLMTGVWGGGLIADAVIRVIVISMVSVSTAAAASTVILLATFAILIAWTRLWLPRMHDREAAAGTVVADQP
jgi:hypothetical protein